MVRPAGHLSSLAALTPNNPQFQPGFEEADTTVQAAVPFYGVYDFTRVEDAMHPSMPELLERWVVKRPHSTDLQSYIDASPVHHVHADAPPFFVSARPQRLAGSRRAGPCLRGAADEKPAASRSCTPSCRSPSTRSTCSVPFVRRTRRWPSSSSWPRSTPEPTRPSTESAPDPSQTSSLRGLRTAFRVFFAVAEAVSEATDPTLRPFFLVVRELADRMRHCTRKHQLYRAGEETPGQFHDRNSDRQQDDRYA